LRYHFSEEFVKILRLAELRCKERWQSGRMHRTRNPAYVNNVSRVQIPVFPPSNEFIV
jgi:hypothetical protein